jgi:hypothetical protein
MTPPTTANVVHRIMMGQALSDLPPLQHVRERPAAALAHG